MSSLEEVSEKVDKIADLFERVGFRLDGIEKSLAECQKNVGDKDEQSHMAHMGDNASRNTTTYDLSQFRPLGQDELSKDFEQIKDSLSYVHLPNTLKVFDNRQGIKQVDQLTLNILSKNARHTETALKWLASVWNDSGVISTGEIERLFTILVHRSPTIRLSIKD